MRLRQIVLVARDLEAVLDDLCAVLRVEVAYRDPGVKAFGLRNAVIPVGDAFLEVVSPIEDDAPAARYLERHGGDGGYMVMLQTDDLAADRARLERLGVRVVWSAELPDIRAAHLHPKDLGGAILSLDEAHPPDSWRWAGPRWRDAVGREGAIALLAAELASPDPGALARRWGEVLARPLEPAGEGRFELRLASGSLRFAAAPEGAGERLVGFEVACADRAGMLETARARGLRLGTDWAEIAGVRIRLA